MTEQLPQTGDWKVTAGAAKAQAVDVTGKHPPRFMEQGRVSSRTGARLQPAPPGNRRP